MNAEGVLESPPKSSRVTLVSGQRDGGALIWGAPLKRSVLSRTSFRDRRTAGALKLTERPLTKIPDVQNLTQKLTQDAVIVVISVTLVTFKPIGISRNQITIERYAIGRKVQVPPSVPNYLAYNKSLRYIRVKLYGDCTAAHVF